MIDGELSLSLTIVLFIGLNKHTKFYNHIETCIKNNGKLQSYPKARYELSAYAPF